MNKKRTEKKEHGRKAEPPQKRDNQKDHKQNANTTGKRPKNKTKEREILKPHLHQPH